MRIDGDAARPVADGDLRPLRPVRDADHGERPRAAVRHVDPVARWRNGQPDRRLAGADLLDDLLLVEVDARDRAGDRVDDERLAALGDDADRARADPELEPADILERLRVEEIRRCCDEVDADGEVPRRVDTDRACARLRVQRRNGLERVEVDDAHRRAERVPDIQPPRLGNVRQAGRIAADRHGRLDSERLRVDDRDLVGVRVGAEHAACRRVEADVDRLGSRRDLRDDFVRIEVDDGDEVAARARDEGAPPDRVDRDSLRIETDWDLGDMPPGRSRIDPAGRSDGEVADGEGRLVHAHEYPRSRLRRD